MRLSAFTLVQLKVVPLIKRILGISSMTQFIRRYKRLIEKLIYRETYTAIDIVKAMKKMGLKPGDTLVVHCAMNNFYNYKGSAQDLIDALLDYIGPTGTLCMPAYPYNKKDERIIFDVINDKTAAGFLAETFRNNPGVLRSMNKLHSVCAKGKNAEYIVSEHHLSLTCFDEHSPYYKIAELGGYSFSLGLPKYFIGTISHVPESLLYKELHFYKDRFSEPVTFHYIDKNGKDYWHTMFSKAKHPYIRPRSTKFVDKYFDKSKFSRVKLSNIWINMYDANYTISRLLELAIEGKTLYNNCR